MTGRLALAAVLTCAACRHRQLVAPPAAPPVQAPKPQTRTTPRVTPRAPSAPAPQETPAVRAPQNLQSSTDSAGNRAAIETRLREVRSQLETLRRLTLAAAAAQDRERIAGMLDLAQQALNRGNLRQAEELSTRAAMLARTLTDGR